MTDTIENQNPESPRDWAWDVPEKYDLHVNGGLLLDAVKPVSEAVGKWRFASVTSKPFGIEEDVDIPKPDEKPPKKKKQAGTPQYGRWRVKIAPNWSELTPEQEAKAEDILQDLPVIYIKTPEKDGVYDEFTAGQFATILANALNMYKEFAEHWREKKLDIDSLDSDPLISSWKFVQEHIIPLLKTQFVEAAKTSDSPRNRTKSPQTTNWKRTRKTGTARDGSLLSSNPGNTWKSLRPGVRPCRTRTSPRCSGCSLRWRTTTRPGSTMDGR